MAWVNNLSLIDFAIFLFTITLSIGFVIYQKIKHPEGTSLIEYMVAGRTLTLPLFVVTLVSTWYGGIFAVTEISFKHGIYNFITQGVFWYLSAFIFAVFITYKACAQKALTFPEIIEKNYGKRSATAFAVLLLIKTLPITYAISIGLFIKCLFGVSLEQGIIIGTMLVTLYCMTGGIKGIIIVDVLQFVLMFVAIFSILLFSLYNFGGFEYLLENLPNTHFQIQGNHNFSTLILWLIIAFNTTILSPVFYQRCFAAKSPKIAKKGILIAMVFWLICDICTTLGGMYAKAHLPFAEPGTAYLAYGLSILPVGMKGLFLAAIFITVFSALDSYLFVASTVLSYDLASDKLRNNRSVRKAAVLLTGVITIIAAFQFNGQLEKAWIFSESFFMAGTFIPLMLAYFAKIKPSEQEVIYGLILTVATLLLWEASGFSVYLESFFVGFLVNCLFFLFTYLRRMALIHNYIR